MLLLVPPLRIDYVCVRRTQGQKAPAHFTVADEARAYGVLCVTFYFFSSSYAYPRTPMEHVARSIHTVSMAVKGGSFIG